MTTEFNFMQQNALQVSSGKSCKNVSGPAGSKVTGLSAGNTDRNRSDANFKTTLRKVSADSTSSRDSRPADRRHSSADEKRLSTERFGDVTSDSAVPADNLIGGHQHHQTTGDTSMGEQDAAFIKTQLLELLKKSEIQNLSFAESGNLLRANANGEPVRLAQPAANEIDENTATRQFVLEKSETILGQLRTIDGFKPAPEMQHMIDVVRAMAGGNGDTEAKIAELDKLVQHLILKPHTAGVEGTIQNSAPRNFSAAIADPDKVIPAQVAKTPISNGFLRSVKTDSIPLDAAKITMTEECGGPEKAKLRLSPSELLYAVARSDVSTNQSLTNDPRAATQTNVLNNLIQGAGTGQKNAEDTPPRKAGDGGLDLADSNLFNNASAPKTETSLQAIKTAALKSEGTPGKEMDGRIVRPDAGKEESFSFSQQASELKTIEGHQISKESGRIPKDFQPQTLNQIVQKAVLHSKEGQNEIQIKLKPDFLGQIRMQIITESQRVTVRILTEHPMIKALIENNVHHLKSGLQHYGLEIDELEVSVAQDSEQQVADRQKAFESKLQAPSEGGDANEVASLENTAAPVPQTISSVENTLIDFFA